MVHLNIWGSISRCACVIVGISSSTDRSGKTESTSSRAHNSCKYFLDEEEMSWGICNLWGSISRYACVSTAGISNSTDRSGKTEPASSRAHNSCKYSLNEEEMSWEICNLWGSSSRYVCVHCGHFQLHRLDPARLNQRAQELIILASTSWTRKKCREKFAICEVNQ